jgi:hypothetical protein
MEDRLTESEARDAYSRAIYHARYQSDPQARQRAMEYALALYTCIQLYRQINAMKLETF